ncbi:MAG: Rne/Rng family ribonuclease [Alphaproteobacteria bacterium]
MSTKRMFIDAAHPEEVRVAVVDDKNKLEELDFETSTKAILKGNIYLAKVTRVEPSLQAAFVEYGGNRHGFLPFSEIHSDYFRIPVEDRERIQGEIDQCKKSSKSSADEDDDVEQADTEAPADDAGQATDAAAPEESSEAKPANTAEQSNTSNEKVDSFHDRYNIQEVIQRNQILLIQVTKEERKNKGAALTSHLSLAGRYCVLMPNSARSGGVSRKITSYNDRKRLREALREVNTPEGMSLIVRTAGKDLSKAEIKRDAEYLMKLWDRIREKTMESTAPALIYEEANLIKRALRDMYNKTVDKIIVEGDECYKLAREFINDILPSHVRKVQQYKSDHTPIFQHYGIEEQIAALHDPTVQLPSGGSIVFNPTEALVAVDINSGKSTKERHIDKTALNTNMEASVEIARQLKLRDLGGLIVIDYIDMENDSHIKSVENALRNALQSDRARTQVGNISSFGLMEMSRQRMRPSIMEIGAMVCPQCHGVGMVRSTESATLDILRVLEERAREKSQRLYTVLAPVDVATFILNSKRRQLHAIEAKHRVSIAVHGRPTLMPPHYEIHEGAYVEQDDFEEPTPMEAPSKSRSQRGRDNKGKQQAPDTPIEYGSEISAANGDEESAEQQRSNRRRGRRGGRRRGGRRGDNRDQGTPMNTGQQQDKKKSWWQRLLD